MSWDAISDFPNAWEQSSSFFAVSKPAPPKPARQPRAATTARSAIDQSGDAMSDDGSDGSCDSLSDCENISDEDVGDFRFRDPTIEAEFSRELGLTGEGLVAAAAAGNKRPAEKKVGVSGKKLGKAKGWKKRSGAMDSSGSGNYGFQDAIWKTASSGKKKLLRTGKKGRSAGKKVSEGAEKAGSKKPTSVSTSRKAGSKKSGVKKSGTKKSGSSK